jgi:hypothetical protein
VSTFLLPGGHGASENSMRTEHGHYHEMCRESRRGLSKLLRLVSNTLPGCSFHPSLTPDLKSTAHPPSISASTSLPPLPPNRHTDSTQTQSHPHRHHNENHHHTDQLAARLTAAESEKEAWRREVRRLRREVDSLRRAVLEDEAVKEVGARARETLRGRESVQSSSHSHSHSHSQSYRDKERPEIPSFGLHNAPQIDVTAIFDSIDTYDSRPPRTRGSTLERDIRTDTPDSKTLDSLLRGDGDASLEIDPEVVLLMDEVRRREFGR